MQTVDPEKDLEPGFVLSDGGAQELMDDLWRLGIRPTKGTARGEVEDAMRSHLEDLRAVAFHALKVPRVDQ